MMMMMMIMLLLVMMLMMTMMRRGERGQKVVTIGSRIVGVLASVVESDLRPVVVFVEDSDADVDRAAQGRLVLVHCRYDEVEL